MALNLIVRYRVITNRNATVLAGNYINVYWDDSTEVIEVQQFDNASDTSGTVITTGPDLGADRIDYEPVTSVRPIPYSYCQTTSLITFVQKTLFPYVDQILTPGHFSCSLTVCDLQISDDFTIQAASDFVTPDGAFALTATSSNGDIKYSLDPEFDYSTEGQSSGTFEGLYAGEHTITAKDELGCVDQITLTIPVPDFYNPLYRLEYDAIQGAEGAPTTPTRIDILERGYTGEVTEVSGDGDPFILRYNGSGEINKFTTIIASEARLTIMSETNFQFRDLFSEDERKYQIRYYKSPGISGSFTPDTLDALPDWIEDTTSIGVPWLTLNPSPNIQWGGTGSSRKIYTLYNFEAGRSYSFDYSVTIAGAGGGSLDPNVRSYFRIEVTNSIGENLGANFQVETSTANTFTGTHTFTSPAGVDRIRVYFFQEVDGSFIALTNYTINSLTNNTSSSGTSIVTYDLKWLGYIISSNYSEAYLSPPYPVTIVATDGLADLKNYDYLDKDENKYREDQNTLTAITEILAKTDLSINILSAINRYEEDMDKTDTDDPLNQCKFNPETFYHDNSIKSCAEVLEEILKPFGARILQRNGKWCIYSIEEFVSAADYREFDSNGVYLGEGIINDVVDIDVPIIQTRAAFINRQQVLEMIPSYGKFFLEHTLLKHDSLVASHGFEEDDIFINPDGIVTFKNWNVNISNHPGLTYGIKKTEALDGDFNFYAKRGSINDTEGPTSGVVTLTSDSFPIEFDSNDLFEFRFEYAIILSANTETASINFINPLWVKLKWRLKIGSYYFDENAGLWTTTDTYNDVYCSSFNDSQEVKIVGPFRDVAELTTETASVDFIFNYETTVEVSAASEASLISGIKALDTTDLPIGYRIKTHVQYTNAFGAREKNLYYILIDDDPSDNGLETIVPTDFVANTNEKVWDLEESVENYKSRSRTSILNSNPAHEAKVEYNYLDNVVLLLHPNGEEAPDNVTIQRNNNAGIKIDFEESYLLNDIDLENINNSERTYKNYFKKLDGTPTQVWARSYRTGTGKLLDLLSNDVVSQYKRGSNKLTGSFITDTEVLPTSVMNEVNDGNKKYMFMGYELHDKTSSIGFDILEVQDTVTDDESTEIDAGFTTGFSLGFRS